MGVRPLIFGKTLGCITKMLPQLKRYTLMMLILIKYHLELRKGVSNVITENLGVGGRNVTDFLGDLNQTHIFSETKKYAVCALSRPNSCYFRIL